MTIQRLREARHAEPFRPFMIRMADGIEYRVPHPEFLFIPPKAERTFIVAGENGGEDYTVLDLLLVTALEFKTDRRGQKRRTA